MSSSETSAQRLRAAVTAGAFEEARRLLGAYTQEVERMLRRLGPSDPSALRLAAETGEFLQWAKRLVLCQRAQLAAQRQELATQSVAVSYPTGPVRRRRTNTWEMEG